MTDPQQPPSTGQLKVLALAEAANPEWTSVPLIGWSLWKALTEVADVHLVTQVRNRAALLRQGLVEGRDFTAIDNEAVARPLFNLAERLRGGAGKGWTMSTAYASLAYYSFESQVWHRFRERLLRKEFDVVHRITPLSPTSQSLIASRLARIDVPFVIGPLNGGIPWPEAFRNRQRQEREWLAHVRSLYRLLPAYRSTRLKSSAIISGSRYTQGEMPRSVSRKSIYIPENGVDLQRFNLVRQPRSSLPLHGVFVGRLVPLKCTDILIRAAASFLQAGSLVLHIIGDGPERDNLLQLAKDLAVEDKVIFHGWIANTEVQVKLVECDFLALPSIKEFGGGVVLEAMALGIAPVVADYGGPAELVDETVGIRIPFTDEVTLLEGFRGAMADCIGNPERLNELGMAAKQRVEQKYTWQAKARQIVRIYEAVVGREQNLEYLSA